MSPEPRVREVERTQPLVNRERPAHELARVRDPSGFDFPASGRFVQRAREHLRNITGADGLPAEFEADPIVHTTSGGATAVHLRQQFKSIPIFLAAQTVRFKPTGELEGAVGSAFAIDGDVPVAPQLGAPQAVLQAAKHVVQVGQGLLGEEDPLGQPLDAPQVDVSGFQPRVVVAFPDVPTQPTVVEAGPFGAPIRASLIWYPATTGLRLSWQTYITMPHGAGQYRVIVDAQNGEILYSRQLIQMLEGRGNVYRVDGSARQMTAFPRPWADYGIPVPTWDPAFPAQPDHWLDGPTTAGNAVNAHLGDSGGPIQGSLQGTAIVFDPGEATGDDQKVLSIFYYNNVMHDLFYLLGFREQDGNFQLDTKGRGGMPADAVDARAHSQSVWGTANMLTPVDGTSPTMNMGLVMDTGRHTAFDSTVVFHEYMHGVTHRLVGGAMNDHALDEPQSKAMGEGWGDYIACTVNEVVTVGHWVKRRPEGIRSARYDDSYPGRYGNIGTGLYTQAHRVGEIWCATLLQLNRNLDARLGAPQGRNLALQLVVDALKLSPANPNMLDMRDAILRALDSKHTAAPPAPRLGDDQYEAAKAEIWKAFAKFGMGANARSAGAKFDGVVGDSTLPAGVGAVTPSPSTPTVPTDTRPTTPTAPLPGGVIRPSDPAGVAIPDDSADGVTRTLTVTESGPIKRIAVHVDIEHAYPGDLEILLVSPGGTTVRLYNRAFKAEPTLVREFRPEDTPALAGLVGKPVQGAWNLKVMDRSPGETGRLRSWSLEIELAGAAPLGEGFEGPPGTLGLAAEVAQAQGALRRLLETLERLMTRLGGAPG